MQWNHELSGGLMRLPIADHDGEAVFTLLSNPDAVAHQPSGTHTSSVQALDLLRRVGMSFEARQAVTWLVFDHQDQIKAMLSLYDINWLNLSARLRFAALKSDADVLSEAVAQVITLAQTSLGLHRIEVRQAKGVDTHRAILDALAFEHEGCLPKQVEIDGVAFDQDVYSILLARHKADNA